MLRPTPLIEGTSANGTNLIFRLELNSVGPEGKRARVAQLFRISERAALNWQRRWQQVRGVSSSRGAQA